MLKKSSNKYTRQYILRSFILAFLGCTTFLLYSQEKVLWRNKADLKNATFYEIQRDFAGYWDGKTPLKGQGYKVFKRWENYVAPRVYPSGDLRLPSMAYENFMEWKKELPRHGKSISLRSEGWLPLGPAVIPTGYDVASGRIDFVRFHPTDPNTLFVGAPDGGLWKSIDGGDSWITNTDFLPIIGCSDLAIDPSNTQIIYLATGNWENDRRSIGILKSNDGGTSWNPTSLTWTALDNYKIRRLVMHPDNPLIMIVATDGGIFKTTDGWETYTEVYCCNTVYDIEFKPGDPDIVYACGKDYWRSIDGGDTWTLITEGLPIESSVVRMLIAVTPANPSYVYIIAGNTEHGYRGTYRSTDSGENFVEQSSTPNILGYDKIDPEGNSGQAGHDLAIVVSPEDAELVTIGGINAWQSENGGVTWTCIGYWLGTDVDYPEQGEGPPDYIHADIQDLQYLPDSSSIMFATSDGGIYKSINNGLNWTKISNNLSVAQQTGIAQSANSPYLLVCGEQDIGTVKLSGKGQWSGIGGGDGEAVIIHRKDDNIIINSSTSGDHYISFNGGTSSTQILGLPTGPNQAEFFSPLSQDPVDASTLYAGGREKLYRKKDLFTNNDGVWETLGTPSGTGNIIRFAVAPSNNSIIYAVKIDAVSKSIDAGQT